MSLFRVATAKELVKHVDETAQLIGNVLHSFARPLSPLQVAVLGAFTRDIKPELVDAAAAAAAAQNTCHVCAFADAVEKLVGLPAGHWPRCGTPELPNRELPAPTAAQAELLAAMKQASVKQCVPEWALRLEWPRMNADTRGSEGGLISGSLVEMFDEAGRLLHRAEALTRRVRDARSLATCDGDLAGSLRRAEHSLTSAAWYLDNARFEMGRESP